MIFGDSDRWMAPLGRWALPALLGAALALAGGDAAAQQQGAGKARQAKGADKPAPKPAPAKAEGAAAPQVYCVQVARANLRNGPGTDHRITWNVARYTPLVLVEQAEGWIKVKDVDGDTHWISEKLVSDKTQCVTVRVKQANVRKRPSNKAARWFTVDKYNAFRQLGRQGRWVQVEYEGEKMWIAASVVWPDAP